MNRYRIDYGWGVATFWCNQGDHETVVKEFYKCANSCFGIRKSITIDPEILHESCNAELPEEYQGLGITHLLFHSGDEIAFDSNFTENKHEYWKIRNEHEDWCQCPNLGEYSRSCEVHKWYIKEKTVTK